MIKVERYMEESRMEAKREKYLHQGLAMRGDMMCLAKSPGLGALYSVNY